MLLVRGALADGDRDRATALARQTQRLALITPGDADMVAAADHARGLTEQDPTALCAAAGRYTAARDGALEDAGNAWAGHGNRDRATTLLGQAYAQYEELGDADDLARVRSSLPGRRTASATGPTPTGRPSAGTA